MVPATTKHLILNPALSSEEPVGDQAHEARTLAAATPQGMVEQRLRDLDREWDAERVTATLSGLTLVAGAALVLHLGERWLALPALIGACLLLQGLAGWTPGLGLIRRLGFRTRLRIAQEHWTLRARRGDFEVGGPLATEQDREDLSRFENEGGAAAPAVDTSARDSAEDKAWLRDR